jgi:hypothetical protein
METVATITMLLATLGLLALMVAASRGFRLPTRLFQPRTWMTAVAITGTVGGATTLGAMLAGGTAIAAFAIGFTALLLVVELALWSDAFTFGSRDR